MYNTLVIISGTPKTWVPAWYAKRTARRAARYAEANPGLQRLVVHCRPAHAMESDHLVDESIEQELRRMFGRIMHLDPADFDYDPYSFT